MKMKDSHGYAPVHYAAKFNRPEIMRMLVDGGAGMLLELYLLDMQPLLPHRLWHWIPISIDIKSKTISEEYTPLHLAACYLRHASKPCKSDDRRHPPLERQTSCKEIFEYLVTDCKEIDVCMG